MMEDYESEENLLEGIQMTTSISCHYQQDISAQSHIENYQGISFTVEDDQFFLSSNQEQESIPSINLSYNHLSQTQSKARTNFTRNISQKKRTNKCSVKKGFEQKKESDKKLSKIIDLDNKLVQIKCGGLLQHSFELMQRVAQIILTQEYCEFRVYEKKLLEILKDLQFCMTQFQKQKKSLINQINLLKSDNQNLKSTVNILSGIIKQLQTSFFKQKSIQPLTFSPYSRDKTIQNTQFSVSSFVPSFKQLNLQQIIEKQRKDVDSIKMQDFAQFLYEVKRRIQRVTYNQMDAVEAPKIYVRIIDRFKKQSIIRDWIVSIVASLYKLQNDKKQSIITFSGNYFQQKLKQQKLIQRFLSIFISNKNKFAQKISQSRSKERQFWFIAHSSLFTFIGILINESTKLQKNCSQQDNDKEQIFKILKAINTLKEQAQIKLSPIQESYLNKLQSLLCQIYQLSLGKISKFSK